MTEDDGRYIPEEIPLAFWQIVEACQASADELRVKLLTMSAEDIIKFYWNYEEAVAQIKPIYDEFSDFSEDSIDEVCYWVVAQGAEAYKTLWDEGDVAIASKGSPFSRLRSDPGLVSEALEVYSERFHQRLPEKDHANFVE